LVAGVKIHRDQRALLWFDRTDPMAIAQFKTVVSESADEIEHLAVRFDFFIGLGSQRRTGRAQN
jgi:hypothetical protein